MLQRLILLFIFVPLIELGLLIKIGQFVGAFNTVLIVLLTGILGAYLAKMEGLKVWNSFQAELLHGNMPADKLLDGVLILIGGILLLTPGILTDLLGLFLLLNWGRALIKKILQSQISKHFQVKNKRYYIEHR